MPHSSGTSRPHRSPTAMSVFVMAAATVLLTGCAHLGIGAGPSAIRLIADVRVDLPTTVIIDESGRDRVASAMPDPAVAAAITAVSMDDELLVVAWYESCSSENPRLRWRGDNHLQMTTDDTGVNCVQAQPAVAVFAVERAGLPNHVTLGRSPEPHPQDRVLVVPSTSS